VIEGQTISVDFGSAPVEAFRSLLQLLEQAGCKRARVVSDPC